MNKYDTLRANAGFSWKVFGNVYALMEYERVSLLEYYTDPDAGIRLFRDGRPKLTDLFGGDVVLPGVSTPDTSYGHVSALGAAIRYPGDGEMAVSQLFGSLKDGVAHLKALTGAEDYAHCGLVPAHLAYRKRLMQAFPGEPVNFGASGQGPVTTAYLLHGEEIFLELYDNPELLGEYLALLAASENRYHAFVRESILGVPAVNGTYGYLADDAAAFVPPGLFASMVLPHWEAQFRARTTGTRYLHCEDFRPAQLPFLEQAGVEYYDPSVSPELIPPVIRDRCPVPFDWRMVSYHLWAMTVQQVFDYVVHLAADGASGTYLVIAQNMSAGENLKKVQAYIEACKQVSAALAGGCTREGLRALASQPDGAAYWRSWIGYKGAGKP